MNKHKYVILNCGGLPAVHIFPEYFNHEDIFNGMRRNAPIELDCARKPIGAGFCYLENGRWKTEGGSYSLHTPHNEEDAAILNRAFGLEV